MPLLHGGGVDRLWRGRNRCGCCGEFFSVEVEDALECRMQFACLLEFLRLSSLPLIGCYRDP
jgi:hypothetical protein